MARGVALQHAWAVLSAFKQLQNAMRIYNFFYWSRQIIPWCMRMLAVFGSDPRSGLAVLGVGGMVVGGAGAGPYADA